MSVRVTIMCPKRMSNNKNDGRVRLYVGVLERIDPQAERSLDRVDVALLLRMFKDHWFTAVLHRLRGASPEASEAVWKEVMTTFGFKANGREARWVRPTASSSRRQTAYIQDGFGQARPYPWTEMAMAWALIRASEDGGRYGGPDEAKLYGGLKAIIEALVGRKVCPSFSMWCVWKVEGLRAYDATQEDVLLNGTSVCLPCEKLHLCPIDDARSHTDNSNILVTGVNGCALGAPVLLYRAGDSDA